MSQDLNDIEWASLARYLAGEGSAAEVEHWMSADPERSVWVGQLRQVFEARQRVPDEWNIETELSRFRARVKAHTSTEHAVFKGRKALGTQPLRRALFNGRLRSSRLWYATATLLIATLGVVVGWHERGQRFLSRTSHTVSTYATANGQRATITLLDGTTVVLNVASRLDVPKDYAAGNHTVYLSGEALFTVSHHDEKPFTVVAGTTITKVLGTTFVVRRYGTDTAVTVAVRDGRVAVGPTVVTAARLVEVGHTGRAHLGVATPSLFSFATGVLALDSMPLSAAIPELDRWYDAQIRLGDRALETKPIEGNIPAGSLADLTAILELTDIRVVRDGRVLTLYPR